MYIYHTYAFYGEVILHFQSISGYVTLGIFKNETNKEGGAADGCRMLQGFGILHGLEVWRFAFFKDWSRPLFYVKKVLGTEMNWETIVNSFPVQSTLSMFEHKFGETRCPNVVEVRNGCGKESVDK